MWNNLLRRAGGPANSDNASSRRRYERRGGDLCMARLGGQSFPVRDWSFGGVRIDADGRSFPLGHMFDVTLSVKATDRIWDVNHTATVVRKSSNDVALQFDPLPGHVRLALENIQRRVRQAKFASE